MNYKKNAARGFTIIESLIVLAITAVAALSLARAARSYFQDRQAQQVADSITVIGKATAAYLSKQGSLIPTTPTDVTLAQLIADNDLPANFTGALPWGGTAPYYFVRVQRIPSGATAQYKALVFTRTAWLVDGKTRYDLVGNAMRKIGGPGGMTGNPALPPPAAGAGPAGLNAQWAEPSATFPPSSPYLASGGQLFYNVAYSMSDLNAQYLRLDGTNQMAATLNMGNNAIGAVTDVNATGTVTAGTVTAANIGATSSIVSNGVINSVGTITGNGAINAGGTVSGANVFTGGTVTANAVNSSTVTASNTITATNDIKSLTGSLTAKTDVFITDLATRDATPITTSLKTLAPRLVEMATFLVDSSSTAVDGAVIPKPSCINSGTPDIFIIPNKEGGTTTNGKFGVVARAIPSGSNWVLSITDMQFTSPQTQGNPVPNVDVPNYGAIIRTFCTY